MDFLLGQTEPLLAIRGLGKTFGRHVALKTIDLDVHEGEFLSFLGPSGCGKSTLLRIITGLERQSAGTISQGGRDISALSPVGRGFGILFQSYALFPNLTVRQNVAYGLNGAGQEADARVAELLEMVGLPGIGGKFPSQLSGGQQQRVALARALAPSPKLLLLDEPLSALDAKVRVHLREQIKDLQRRLGITTIMVTHDQEEALAMADRIVVMNHGTVEQVGTPGCIYRHPASLFVASFVGKMNVLPGQVTGGAFRPHGAAAAVALLQGVREGTAQLCVRPEDVEVSVAADVAGVAASVESVEFLGAFTRLRLVVPAWGGVVLSADVAARQMRDLAIGPGAPVWIALDPARLQLLPGDGDA
ncbi:putative 2-aminoethylphosphonate ABC transporter ATP-binding protein [Bosea sp. (in: a-proteobacteria)]|jgi:iron(III) transport system ATP-binding protein|uniref:putative 2-aminoethylphosphonate ABC transporter ATP-binding protein n=1 Tax=Bosea sp. (in: a-proteobacteria) TaxID=1871050 RepID=UPI002DDD47D1|nr:putative 2-aminoethylphosphonate ABC transporter ATP-binding protein [Bosea sp. (in: a-proteobacteria)]HEV2508398.1 putative 2-aminoethylphosphonate ABC transporter ATP-binding protein [Bosea sp. (in: a-proteobacteria)]